jgi:hypothetical protein
MKNFNFEYKHQGTDVIEAVPDQKITLNVKNTDSTGKWYNCLILRPSRLAIDPNNPKLSATKIKLVFESDYDIEVRFSVTSTYEGNKPQVECNIF